MQTDAAVSASTDAQLAQPSATRARLRLSPSVLSALALTALVVAGAVLRFWGVGANRLGYDEAFTAMAGRKPLGDMFSFLQANDSHPPLDYLIRSPLARFGVDEFLFRLPSVLCSVGALALFAWWMRRRGFAGVVATGLMAFSAFELIHGRTARMYAELELFGVAAAVIADAWLRRPRRWHAPAVAGLLLLTLLTHVSGFLLGAGLLLLPGWRRDREAWRWRAAVAAAGAGWALLWGRAFLVQAGGKHSDWIPRTTLDRTVHTFARLVSYEPRLAVIVLAAVALGGLVVWRVDRRLARVLVCCALMPALLAAAAGTVAPVLIDRTLTAFVWAPLVAIGFLAGEVARHARVAGAVMVVVLALVAVPAALHVPVTRSNPDMLLRHLENVARPGDVVAMRPADKLPELEWSLGVRGALPYRHITLAGIRNSTGLLLGNDEPSGRVWLLDWRTRPLALTTGTRCAPDWSAAGGRVVCLH